MNRSRICAVMLVCIACVLPLAVWGAEQRTGHTITRDCRKNMKEMKEAIEAYMAAGNQNVPTWDSFEHIYTMLLSCKFMKKKPKPPTPDCEYFFIYKDKAHYDWYCSLHGTLSGDKSQTFRYHEFEITAKTSSIYKGNKKYDQHVKNLVRWGSYSPTLMENVIFHYRRNPTITLIIVIVGLACVYFVYKNIFGP